MKTLINKLISRKLIYILLITMAVIGIIVTTAKMFPEIELSGNEKNASKITLASTETYTTSRASDETREYLENNEFEIIQEETAEDEESKDNTDEENQENKTEKGDSQEEVKATKTSNKEETTETKKEDTTSYISIEDVTISKTMDLTVRTGLSRKDFIKLIAGVKYDTSGFFEENAGTIYDLCEEYSINEIFFCGLISAESGWDIASNHRTTHNYISLMQNGKLIQYSSVEEGLEVAAQKLHNNYLTSGGKFYNGKTLAGVKVKFCPASSTWVDLVYGRMKQILY